MQVNKPTIYIFSGLPGTGKSTLAQALTQAVNGVYLRIDTIEQALRDLCNVDVVAQGYRLAYRLAADNLLLGRSVVSDSCNPIELTRREWIDVARESGASWKNIEVLCSDTREHKHRVERRKPPIPGLDLPSWSQVEKREYQRRWHCERISIDTAGKSIASSVEELLAKLHRIADR